MLFVDTQSNVDKSALQEYVLNELKKLKKEADGLFSGANKTKWKKIHDVLVSKEKNKARQIEEVLSDLAEVPTYIDSWITSAVESPERFEFFILSKAEEVSGGDQEHDYYWALQIRHDQLVGLVNVLKALIPRMDSYLHMDPEKILTDPVFRGLMDHEIDDQVYIEAEKIHKQRLKIIG